MGTDPGVPSSPHRRCCSADQSDVGIIREIFFSCYNRSKAQTSFALFFFFGSILSSKSSLGRNSSCCLFSICPYAPHKLSLISVLSLYLAAVIGKDEQRHEGRQHTQTNCPDVLDSCISPRSRILNVLIMSSQHRAAVQSTTGSSLLALGHRLRNSSHHKRPKSAHPQAKVKTWDEPDQHQCLHWACLRVDLFSDFETGPSQTPHSHHPELTCLPKHHLSCLLFQLCFFYPLKFYAS